MDLEDGSRSSKHSESKPEIIDGRDNYETYPKLRVRIASSDHFEVPPEIIDESGSSKHSGSPPKVVDGSDSSKHAKSRQCTRGNEGGLLIPAVSLGSSLSSRSSSSASSLEDLIQVKTKDVLNPNMHGTCSDGVDKDIQQKLKGHDNDMSSNSSSKSEKSENGLSGPTGISPVSGITHESQTPTMSPMQSPVVQVMDRTSGYDPHRIPSIIFDRPMTPMDWSTTSNDSLFSIHMGNNSFSNDNLFMPGDVVKSGEPTNSGESMFSQPPPFAAMHRDTKSSIPVLGTGQQTVKTEKIEATGIAQLNIKDAKTGTAENPTEDKNPAPSVSWKSSATASHSDESRDSVTSFAFPILADGIRSSIAKASDEDQQLQPSTPSVNKKSASCCCIHCCRCISCWPWGCTNHCHCC